MSDNNNSKKSRRVISVAIIAAVIAISVALGLSHRVQSGEIPLRAASDGFRGVIVAWQDEGNIYTPSLLPMKNRTSGDNE